MNWDYRGYSIEIDGQGKFYTTFDEVETTHVATKVEIERLIGRRVSNIAKKRKICLPVAIGILDNVASCTITGVNRSTGEATGDDIPEENTRHHWHERRKVFPDHPTVLEVRKRAVFYGRQVELLEINVDEGHGRISAEAYDDVLDGIVERVRIADDRVSQIVIEYDPDVEPMPDQEADD